MKNSKIILKFFGIFILAYAIFLPTWLIVKNPYNRAITEVSFALSSWKYDLHVSQSTMKGREMTFTVSNTIPILDARGNNKGFFIDLSFDIESVTFNIPMTLSLLSALILSFGISAKENIRLTLVGMGALLALHIVTLIVISISLFAGAAQSSQVVHFYLSRFSLPMDVLDNLGMILNSYAARFEPFLIAIIVWWQLQIQNEKQKKSDTLAHF
ncbi:MAG: hypothetical protein U9R50_12490 [Campylobacterota bacterium]|nr:hypothetical protein [Campylobacterota bacterium]